MINKIAYVDLAWSGDAMYAIEESYNPDKTFKNLATDEETNYLLDYFVPTIEIDGEEKVSVPAHNIEAIVCFGQNTVSTPLIGFCGEEGISLVFLSENGKFLGRICGPASGNVLLRKKQYESLNDIEFSTRTVRNILYGKIRNAKVVLMRNARNKDSDEKRSALVAAADKLSNIAKKLQNVNDSFNFLFINIICSECE